MNDVEDWDLIVNPERVYASECPGNTTGYEVVGEVAGDKRFSFHGWPPRGHFFNQVRARVFRVLLESQFAKGVRTERFRGAMDAGVDARRTLLGAFRGEPFLYVKTGMPRQERLARPVSDSLEPIVWIFQPLRECAEHELSWKTVAPWTEDSFISDCGARWSTQYFEFGRQTGRGAIGRKVVRFDHYLGMVTFTRWATDSVKIRIEHGGEDAAVQRVPKTGQNYIPPSGPWWEQLLSIAAHYSKECVYCVTLDETGAYDQLVGRSPVAEKRLAVVRGTDVGNRDVLRLSIDPFVNKGQFSAPKEALHRKLKSLYNNAIQFLDELYPPTYRHFR